MKKLNFKLINLFLFLILAFNQTHVHSQQTIINVPSSEVLPTGDIVLKDSNKFRPFSPGEFASFTPSVTLGVGHGAEVSTGVGTSIWSNNNVRGDVAAKKVWFMGNSTRFTVGGVVSPYLSQAVHPDTFIYAHFSQRIKKTRTSLTAGGYVHGKSHLPDNAGVLFGIEQVIIPNKLRLVADWMSTPDSYGKMGVGFKYRPVPTLSITSAVIIPNQDSDNIAFNISVSKFISLKDDNPIKRRL